LKCSLTVAKLGFYLAANGIFGNIGRSASEEVILQLISDKLQDKFIRDRASNFTKDTVRFFFF